MTPENQLVTAIEEAFKQKGHIKTAKDFASLIGENANGLSDIKAGRKKFTINHIKTLKISHPDFNTDWWTSGGEGSMFMENNGNGKNAAAELAAFKSFIEGKTDYILMHKDLLQDKHRLTSLEQMENDKYFIGRLLDQNEKLIARVLELEAKLPAVEKVK